MAETPAVCEHLHLPLQSGSDRVLAAMHRGYTAERYLERLAAARAAIDDLAVTTDIIVGLPRRDRRRLRAHPRGGGRGRLRQRLHVHLQPPAGHRGRRAGRRVRARRGGGRAVRAPADRGRAIRSRPPRGPRRAGRGGAGRGPVPQGPRRAHRAHPAEQARALRGRAHPGRAATPPCASRAPRRTTSAASSSTSSAAPPTRRGCRSSSGDHDHARSPTTARRPPLLVQALLEDLNDRYADIDDPDDPTRLDDEELPGRGHARRWRRPPARHVPRGVDRRRAGGVRGAEAARHATRRSARSSACTPRRTARRRGVSRAHPRRASRRSPPSSATARLQLETGTAQPEAVRALRVARVAPHHALRALQALAGVRAASPRTSGRRDAGRHAVLVGATGVGKVGAGHGAGPSRPRPGSSSRSTRCRSTGGWTSARPSPPPAEQAEVPPPPARPRSTRGRTAPWPGSSGAARGAVADIEARGRRALLVGGTGLYLQAIVDELDIPGRYPEVRAELEAEPTRPALHARLARARSGGRRPHGARQPPPGRAGPGGDPGQRPALLQLRPRPRRPPAHAVRAGRAAAARPTTCGARIAARYDAQLDGRVPGRGARACSPIPGGRPAPPAQALGYKELPTTSPATLSLDEAVDLAVQRTGRFARRQRAWFRRDPRITWLDLDADDERNLLVDAARRGP